MDDHRSLWRLSPLADASELFAGSWERGEGGHREVGVEEAHPLWAGLVEWEGQGVWFGQEERRVRWRVLSPVEGAG